MKPSEQTIESQAQSREGRSQADTVHRHAEAKDKGIPPVARMPAGGRGSTSCGKRVIGRWMSQKGTRPTSTGS